ncbi:2-methylisocitrate lyase-like PEP mutase family enzyme [Stella humosa]|uniref:2-methylisocitrate lyase-like PEP mutase family enzyme n=1 Tax=Stella humosa TaxID=94 RepID=A0A3N1KW67_9PROT|nr:isocitrate lyase/phosphoenolpyruvate mutase family protein [Stella humosa]ROP83672.1 2-methylisocitrate lyase-like PEP mutase family enzyme [Stella humosa]
MRDREAQARAFHALHGEGQFLILANAWDSGSARLIESLGATAIATTSSGVSWARGYADGHALPIPTMLATIADIARVIQVPLTTDIEGGFSDDPTAVGKLVGEVIAAGAVGVNLEDGSTAPEAFAAKIRAAKEAGANAGVDIFVNARTDVFLRGLAPEGQRVEEVLRRAALYKAAGADGLFVPGAKVDADVAAIAAGCGLPLNIMSQPGVPPAARLRELGARRLSAGGAIAQSVLTAAADLARAFLADGDSDAVTRRAMPYVELQKLNAPRG